MKKIIVCLVLLVCLICFFPFKQVVAISNRKNSSEKIYSSQALEGFVISYTHSVNKGRIHDYYKCTRNGFILEKSVFVSYGAGIPEPEEIQDCDFEITDTGYVLNNLNRELSSFLLSVGVIAEHSITVGGNEYFLKNFFQPKTSLRLQIKRVSILDYKKNNIKKQEAFINE